MKKWNLIIDVAECTNCNLCTLATQDEYVGNQWPGVAAEMPKHGHRWIDIKRRERGQPPLVDVAYLPVMCQHCDDAPCIKAAENNAVTKRDDGIVIIDPEKSVGQRQIMEACPYGVVFWNEEKNIPQAWPFDAHLLDAGWEEPRAATACPTGAFRALKVEDSEMRRIRAEQGLEELEPGAATKPRVFYKNLHRFTKCVVAGSVAGEINGVEECLGGATVTLIKGGDVVARCETDAFGDFKIDRLDPASGGYTVRVAHEGFAAHSIEFELGDSITLGTIRLSPG
ncbi:MAG: carboxypeptidase regulatory-like domain-containing protein [Alphaproteobacteria bacterium]|nr:carboxypeptidase regulatory-like domain-containing protein [Alphaproteobacteria bacterium]